MSLNIGELVAYAKVDHSGVGRGLQAAQRDMRSGMDRLQRDAGDGGTRAGKAAGDGMSSSFKSSVASIGKGLVGVFAVERVVAGLRAMKDAASDLNETSSMSEVIFGRNAAAMKAWAQDGPKLLGLSTEATLRYSASLADMLLQLGYAEDQAAATSRETLQMAADLGSFKNLETADVLERINAGLRGEYDSLQLLIPNINAARVEKEALAATGKTVAASLTAEEKAAAVLAIVQKDGIRASGDFARTKDGEANASKSAAAEAENFAAKLGERLLPAYTALVVFGRDEVIPFLTSAVDYFEAGADAAGPLADAVGGVVASFRAMPGPVQQATLGLIALVALRGRVEAFGTSVNTRLADGARNGSKALDGLRLSIMYASETADTRAGRFAAVSKAIGTSAGTGIRGAASGLVSLLGGPWGLAFVGATAVMGGWLKSQADAKARARELTDTLDEQTGAVTDLTKETVRNQLEQEGVLAAAQRAGLDLQDVFDAAFDPAALQRLNAEADKLLTTASGGSARLADSALADYADIEADLNKVTGAVNAQTGAFADGKAAAERKAQVDIGAATAQDDLGAETSDTTKKIEDQKKALQDAAQATLDLVDAQLSAVDAEISYQKTLVDGAEVVKEYGKKLPDNAKAFDLTTDAGRRAQQVLVDLARDTKAKTEQDAEAGASLGELRSQMQDSRTDFLELADKLGLSESAAKDMAKEFGLTKGSVDAVAKAAEDLPASKQIRVEAYTKKAKDRLNELKRLRDALDGSTVVINSVIGRYVSTSDPTNRGSRALTGGQTIDSADGNILHFADGAEDHRAFIAPRGTPVRRFNEPETGGEAYIPLSPAKRPRSAAILATVADEFGYDLAPRGGGRGTAGSSSTEVSTTYNHFDIRTASFKADYTDVKNKSAEEQARSNLGGGL